MDEPEHIRLQVYLSRSGIASRRKCETLIAGGRVRVNGRVVREMGTKVNPSEDTVRFDGKLVKPEQKSIYIVLNKPDGYLCANDDPYNRPLAIDLLQGDFRERLFHVGRLDFHTRGLILYTNDGKFAERVSHPSMGVQKEYLVETARPFDEHLLQDFQNGIWVENTRYKCIRYEINAPKRIKITLIEGKNREIRKVFEHLRIPIKRLTRVRLGTITLKGLPEGKYRHLTKQEKIFFYRGNT